MSQASPRIVANSFDCLYITTVESSYHVWIGI